MSSGDVRGGLPRRFTTNALPTMSPIAQQRRQAAAGESHLVSSISFHAGAPHGSKRYAMECLEAGQCRNYVGRDPKDYGVN